MPPKARKANPFHAIREREFGRERQFLRGQPAAQVSPSYFTPSLKEICAAVVANTFAQQPSIDGLRDLDPQLFQLITDQLPTDLPLEVAVPRVRVQDYWRSCCEARWSLGQLTEYTGSTKLEPPSKGGWKRVYLERNLEERLMALESSSPTDAEEDAILALSTLCGSEVYAVRLHRQRSHFDLTEFFSRLPHLEEFAVSYGVLNAGVTFNLDMAGMRQQDALGIAKVLRTSKHLVRLSLTENAIDDDLCRAAVAGLVRNTTLTHLDLSHNRISDVGAAALGTVLLQPTLPLRTLHLSDNSVQADGARALGDALAGNTTLLELKLRLNRLGDGGGETLLDGVANNASLTSLDLSSNELGPESARAVLQAAQHHPALLSLDLSCNAFGEEGGALLLQAAEGAQALLEMDLRGSAVAARDEEAIRALLQRRVTARHMDRVDVAEAAMRAEIGRLAAENVRKTHGM